MIIFQVFQQVAKAVHVLEQKVIMPEDIAKAIVFLASDDAGKITGVNLPVDCGATQTSPAYEFAGGKAIPGLEDQF
jgi:NAD(P)-dependent dehydrogenase (short-subunit alcohol dehydrogenase family)